VSPFFLPDGNHFLFNAHEEVARSVLYAAALDSKDRTRVAEGMRMAAYANGFLLFMRDATLLAQRFDPGRLQLTGQPAPVAEQVQVGGPPSFNGVFSASNTGVLVYQRNAVVESELVWFNRSGKELESLRDRADFNYLQLSPDGRQAAVSIPESSKFRDVWIYDTARGVRTRLTSDPSDEFAAVWSPEGQRLVFAAVRKDALDLYQKPSSGNGAEEILAKIPGIEIPTSWSPDGRFLLYNTEAPNADMWVLPLAGDDRKPFPFRVTRFTENAGHFSPDGRWIAYSSNETGRMEVYVAPFQRPGATVPISTNGGGAPQWRRDGKELFYLTEDNRLMAVPIALEKSAIAVGSPHVLFQARFRGNAAPYDVTADGQRFLVNRTVEDSGPAPLTLLVNWPALLTR
jgi:dipeptidyl aminopeptidase/acylaminoacyl peptidase